MFSCLLPKELIVLNRDYLVIFGLLCNTFLLSANPKITALRAGAMCQLAQGNKKYAAVSKLSNSTLKQRLNFSRTLGLFFLTGYIYMSSTQFLASKTEVV